MYVLTASWLLFCAFVANVVADTPANCTYEDIKGVWEFYEGERSGNSELDCSNYGGPTVNKLRFELLFPNIVVDELGNKGYWTIVYNQGFEVVINYRKYFAFSKYEQKGSNVTSYCNTILPGWSHDVLGKNWACYNGNKVGPTSEPKVHYEKQVFQDGIFRQDKDFVHQINKVQKSWTATVYPELEGLPMSDIIRRAGGIKSRIHGSPRIESPYHRNSKRLFTQLPEQFDWRNVGGVNYVSPIRNQGSCGSCFAFSSLAMLESRLRIATNNTLQVTFSPQDVVSCSEYSQGCEGGFPYLVAGKYAQDFGVVPEECNPYTGKDDKCSEKKCKRYYVADYKYVGGFYGAAVDQRTGYNTKNILCMPIFIRTSVIGVVQMVNKIEGSFTKSDEEAFATFAIYCGLALHHAKLYDKIRRSEQKHKVALEILSYHSTCCDDEMQAIRSTKLPIKEDVLKHYNFSATSLSSDEKVVASIFMLTDLPEVKNSISIDHDSLIRFTLTVRKNYRRVPYHNWTHGFSVANSIYTVIKESGVFRPLEELSLYVACLCHDLDHRGKTNQFLVNSASPLAAIYSTSVLEHHHFNMTVSILQQDGHNILRNLSSAEYKMVLNNIKHCILATDLAQFFPNMGKLEKLIKENKFDWEVSEHRLLLQAITMTAADLCASTKSWEQQKEIVKVIFEEFYDQGDTEKQQGIEPIPIMDRNKVNEQPISQVAFLKGICIPCYDLLNTLIPQTKSMLEGCKSNLAMWQKLAQEKENNS